MAASSSVSGLVRSVPSLSSTGSSSSSSSSSSRGVSLVSIPEQEDAVVSFDQPCLKVEDGPCRELAMKVGGTWETWAEIVLKRSSGFQAVFENGGVARLVLDYTGEYHKCCKIAAIKTLVFCPPPIGKPDPQQSLDPELRVPRARIAQAPQKGDTCWFYASRMICQRIGKNPLPCQAKQRKIEQWVSSRRKADTAMHERLYWQQDFAQAMSSAHNGSFTKAEAREFLRRNTASEVAWWRTMKKDKLAPILEAFCKQEEHLELVDFVNDACMKANIEINLNFLREGHVTRTPKEYYEATTQDLMGKSWVDLNLPEKSSAISGFATNVCFSAQGLQKSYWHPSQSIDSLIRELWVHGPHMVSGQIGQVYYADKPKLLAQKVQGRLIYTWAAGAARADVGSTLHCVVIVGADSKLNRVYYIDPLDGSDPRREAEARVYANSYERLKEGIANLDHSARMINRETRKPAFTAMALKLPNAYALHGNPRTDYL